MRIFKPRLKFEIELDPLGFPQELRLNENYYILTKIKYRLRIFRLRVPRLDRKDVVFVVVCCCLFVENIISV